MLNRMLKPKPKRAADPAAAFVASAAVDAPTPPSTADRKDGRDGDWRRVSLLIPHDLLAEIDAISDARSMPRNVWLRTVIIEALDVSRERAARTSTPVNNEGCAFLRAANMRPQGS